MEETARLDCLRALALDTVRQPEIFSRITQLAATMFRCPVSAVTIIEAQHQWFLGRTGIKAERSARDGSFCPICIEQGGPLLIGDALADARFGDDPSRSDHGAIRSYLGVPIRAEAGALLGTLSIAAPWPNAFREDDIGPLRSLAELAEQCIIAHAKTLALAKAHSSLLHLNRVFRQAETAAQIGSWRVDLGDRSLHWSDQVYTIHGLESGTPMDLARAGAFWEPDERERLGQALEDAISTGLPFALEANLRRADGEIRRVRAIGERVDCEGTPESIAGIIFDCTEEHLQTAALKRAAERDRLTGLFNRSAFDKRLSEALSEPTRETCRDPVTVALIDLDGFKTINDTLGHLVGDRLLTQIAEQLNRRIDDSCFLARWGGDEFAVLFPVGMTIEAIEAQMLSLVRDITEQVRVGDELIIVGATCGLAQITGRSSSDELLRRADLALYHGKAHGRGMVHRWSQAMELAQSARHKAIAELTLALEQGRAFAAYQPIVNISDGTVVAVEALLRLSDRKGETITAGEIAPALLDPALSRRVSRFMIEEILREAPRILGLYGPEARIGINVAEADLRSGDFLKLIERLTSSGVLKPRNVTIEVTETMLLLDDCGDIRTLLTTLHQRGFTIALDDFGTGFSSLTHLRDFPITKVKIDRDFISNITTDQQSRLIVQAMVQMGQSLGVRMVAEGVETEEELTFLRAIGCSHAQGYKFAHPQSLRDLEGTAAPAERPKRIRRSAG